MNITIIAYRAESLDFYRAVRLESDINVQYTENVQNAALFVSDRLFDNHSKNHGEEDYGITILANGVLASKTVNDDIMKDARLILEELIAEDELIKERFQQHLDNKRAAEQENDELEMLARLKAKYET